MVVVPLIIALTLIILFVVGMINIPALVKIFAMYIPALSITLLMQYLTGLNKQAGKNKVSSQSSTRTKSIRLTLKKWNVVKFNPLGFTWTYCEETDSLELSIDADLEVTEEQHEGPRKSLKSS